MTLLPPTAQELLERGAQHDNLATGVALEAIEAAIKCEREVARQRGRLGDDEVYERRRENEALLTAAVNEAMERVTRGLENGGEGARQFFEQAQRAEA